MKALPIRIRLTLWYFAMFASAAAFLCLASLWMLRRSVDETEYHDLQERAQDVQLILNHEDPGWNIEQIRSEFAALYDLKDDGKYLQVQDEKGNWIYRSKRIAGHYPDLPAPDRLSKDGLVSELQIGSRKIRFLAYPITARGMRFSVQTGISLNRSKLLLANFRAKLLLLTPIVILLAAIGGHLMSRKALNPVAVLAAEARSINDRNLEIRLPVSSAEDEISDLSRTLNQMLERIDKAFASVRTFTGNASHELRTPISLLRTEIEVALYRPRDSEEYREILGRLHGETIRMTSLVENLLSLARADGGAETIVFGPIRVETLFRQIAETCKAAMNHAMLDFRVEMPDGDLFLLGDTPSISRLLSILLENARKYTPPGGCVTLCAIATEGRARISVQDTGIGVDPQYRNQIFNRFFRIPTAGHVPAGSGLGLSLAKWIAERHNTQLSVDSVLGRGSCFSFSLERADASTHGVHDSRSPSESGTKAPNFAHSRPLQDVTAK